MAITQRPRMLETLIDLRTLLMENNIDPDILPCLALRVSAVREVYEYCCSDQPMPKVGEQITLSGFEAVVVADVSRAPGLRTHA